MANSKIKPGRRFLFLPAWPWLNGWKGSRFVQRFKTSLLRVLKPPKFRHSHEAESFKRDYQEEAARRRFL